MSVKMAEDNEGMNPHPVAEDPEECIGDELPDPWDDVEDNGQWKEVSA